MIVFLDTSAIMAVLNVDDQNHALALPSWQATLSQGDEIVCSNYILIETFALLQSRFGLEAVRLFQSDVLPVLTIFWVNETLHNQSMSALMAANRRKLSLVDCTSFEIIRQSGIPQVFCFDAHFQEQGFEIIPAEHSKS